MWKSGIVIDRRYQDHDTGLGHPERPERIAILFDLLDKYRREALVSLEPRPATREELAANHDPAHIDRVAATAEIAHFAFDADTPTSPRSYTTALLAAGGFLALLEAIMANRVDNGFAFVRPPGHHAERNRAMGFCLFNNVAIGAHHLRRKYGLERILILDWDLHHGNGTQWSFYDQRAVLYISIHQYPYYPGTGAAHEVGRGAGEGFTVNIPLPAGAGDGEYLQAFREIVDPVSRQFAPQCILVSAGFDCHRRDPLGAMEVTAEGFRAMTRILLRIAGDHAQGRWAAILEGGYDLPALQDSVTHVLEELSGKTLDEDICIPAESRALLESVRGVHSRYWQL